MGVGCVCVCGGGGGCFYTRWGIIRNARIELAFLRTCEKVCVCVCVCMCVFAQRGTMSVLAGRKEGTKGKGVYIEGVEAKRK